MQLSKVSPFDLRMEKFINEAILGNNYIKADQNGYFVVYTPDGRENCWKLMDVESLTSADWEIVKEPGF